tara:strand:+ start:938 stop:1135 length:198 start_codon:yes stop_codon:yes gene_type:complete
MIEQNRPKRLQPEEFKSNIKQGAARMEGTKTKAKNAKKCAALKKAFDMGQISKADMMKKAKELGC